MNRASGSATSGWQDLGPRLLQSAAFLAALVFCARTSPASYLWVSYFAIVLVTGPWFFPLVALAGVFATCMGPWLPRPTGASFLIGQSAVVIALTGCGALTRPPEPGSVRAWFLDETGHAARLLIVFLVVLLLAGCALIREAPVLAWTNWAIALTAFAWKGPWPEHKSAVSMREMAVNAVLLFVSLVVGAIMLELASRAMYDNPNVRPPGDGLNEHHGRALFMPRPNHRDRYEAFNLDSTRREFDVQISSQGLREREVGPKGDGECRILTLGDSFTMGWGVEYNETYPRALESRLNERIGGGNIRVINGGVTGYGPWQEAILLEERGWALEPDLIVLQLYPGNDIDNTLTKTGQRLQAYNREWEERIAFWRHVDDWRVQLEWRLLAYSRLYYTLTARSDTRINFEALLGNLRWSPSVDRPIEDPAPRPFSIECLLRDWYPTLTQGWSMLCEDVAHIHANCEAHGVSLVVFTIPTLQDCVDSFWDEAITTAGPQYAYERLKDVRMATEFFQRAGLVSIDVPGVILAHENPSSLFLLDGHLSPEGNIVLADEVARSLAAAIQTRMTSSGFVHPAG